MAPASGCGRLIGTRCGATILCTTRPPTGGASPRGGCCAADTWLLSPPTSGPCCYGSDTPTRGELVSSNQSVAEVRDTIGADSLAYLSLPALRTVAAGMKHGFCDACFSGEYPVPVDEAEPGGLQLPLFESAAPDREPGD